MKELVNNNDVMVKITKLEVDVGYIKKNIDEIKSLLGSMPTTYATKPELEEVRQSIKEHKDSSAGWIKAAIPWAISFVSLCISFYFLIK